MESETELTAAAPPGVPHPEAEPWENPFIGPRSFKKGETLFGRDREAEDLVDLLIAERIVLLYSPSGAGKTSLVQAKLWPMLEDEGFAIRPIVRVSYAPSAEEIKAGFTNRYLFSTLRSLEQGLPDEAQPPPGVVAGQTLSDFLTSTAANGGKAGRELIIFDQFEEILTIAPNAIAEKEAFFDQVGEALRDKNRWALFSMREDFVPALDPYLRRIPRRLASRFRLDLLGVEAARQAILGPVEADGAKVLAQVVDGLVEDLRQVRVQQLDDSIVQQAGPYIEPVQLQVVCFRVWNNLVKTGRLSEAGANLAIGDVDTALAGYYSDCVAKIAGDTQIPERTIRDWCDTQLITEQGIRGQVLSENSASSRGLDTRAIKGLIDAHLVRSEERRGAKWYELAHDRLIAPVRASNHDWRMRNLNLAQLRAAQWIKENRSVSLLFTGKELENAEAWAAAQPEGTLLPYEAEFLVACKAGRELQLYEDAKEERKRLKGVVIRGSVAIGILVVLLTSTIWLWGSAARQTMAAKEAADQAKIAETSANIDKKIAERQTKVAEKQLKETQRAIAELEKVLASKKESQSVLDTQNASNPLAYLVKFEDGSGSLVFKNAVDIDLHVAPIALSLNQERVVKPTPPRIDLFNVVEIFEKVDDRNYPLVWSDRVANTYFLSTYQRAKPPGAPFGTSVVGSPSFRREGEKLDFVPTVNKVDLEKVGSDPLRSTTSASFGSYAEVTSVRTFPRPVLGQTTTQLSLTFKATRAITLEAKQLKCDAFRLVTLSSMFSDSEHFNANLIRYEDENHQVHSIALNDFKDRGRHLFLDDSGVGRAVKLGRWFELVKQNGSSWFSDSPTIRVEIGAQRGTTCVLGLQGWLDALQFPTDDSLQVWVEWLDAPKVIPVDTQLGIDFTIIARPPG